MFLIDSSIYINVLRQGEDPVRVFSAEFDAGSLVTCGIVTCEVLRGIRDPLVFDRMEEFFDLIDSVDFDDALWRSAHNLAWQLDRKGQVLPLSDILIGAAALHTDAIVISTDTHFQRIPDLVVRSAVRQ